MNSHDKAGTIIAISFVIGLVITFYIIGNVQNKDNCYKANPNHGEVCK